MKIEKFDIAPVNGNKLGTEPLITTKVDFLTYSQKIKLNLLSPEKIKNSVGVNEKRESRNKIQELKSDVTLFSKAKKIGNHQ